MLESMNWTATAAIMLALAVAIGAFGAHGLQGRLDAYSIGVYEKGVFYHFVHALGMLAVPLLVRAGLISAAGGHVDELAAAGGNRTVFGQPVRAGDHGRQNARCHHAVRRGFLYRGVAGAGRLRATVARQLVWI